MRETSEPEKSKPADDESIGGSERVREQLTDVTHLNYISKDKIKQVLEFGREFLSVNDKYPISIEEPNHWEVSSSTSSQAVHLLLALSFTLENTHCRRIGRSRSQRCLRVGRIRCRDSKT